MSDRAHETAALLLRLGAVSINTKLLFTYASGIKSPIYTDNRLLISYPEERRRISKMLVAAADEVVGVENIDVVAGTATAGIPFAAWLADRIQRPMVYVRAAAKSHGTARSIEGVLRPDQRAVVVEDLVTFGGSSLNTVDALRAEGATVLACLAIFSYEFDQARRAYEARGVPLIPLTTLSVLLEVAVAGGYIGAQDVATVLDWAAKANRASA